MRIFSYEREPDDEEDKLPFTTLVEDQCDLYTGPKNEYISNLGQSDLDLQKCNIKFQRSILSNCFDSKENAFNVVNLTDNHTLNDPLSTGAKRFDTIFNKIQTAQATVLGKRKRNLFFDKENLQAESPPLPKESKPITYSRNWTPVCRRDIKRKLDQVSSQIVLESDIIAEKKPKPGIMSMYDRRVSSDERPIVGNGFISRTHNDDNSNALTNHFYSCSQPTMATLCNIGNTCYLNSVVYTLRFAPKFLHNLHHLVNDLSNVQRSIGKYRAKSSSLGRNVSGIHMENARSWSSKDLASLETSSCDIPRSNQQVATEKLHELYMHLHRNEINEVTEPFHADTFLHAIQEVSAIFEGNQQQDAHEFLMCVLDSIRETCQSLIKAVLECPDVISNGFVSLPEQTEVPTAKEQPSQRESSGSNIIKTSFFRKSKRKDDTKNSKNSRLQSPFKDNTQSLSGDSIDGLNNDKGTSKSTPNLDDDVTVKDKERISEKIKKLGLDFFTEDFEGITVSTTKCLSCETVTEQKETMIDIAVPISGYGNTDMEDKTHSFIQNSCITREYFRGENKYRCEQCIGYTEAIRSISYEVLPRLLVIQLSRFSGGMEKINSYLPTPFTLQCFCAKCCQLDESHKLHIYKLYSVITHVGATISVGHYIAYTCSLDWANDYINCPKDRKKQGRLIPARGSIGSTNSNSVNNVKKKLFSRNKASSSGDMSKTVKNINGISSKTMTNGMDKVNTTCQSVSCCGVRLRNNTCPNPSYNNGSCNSTTNGLYIDLEDSQGSHSYNSTSFSNPLNVAMGNRTAKVQNSNEPVWYMCDDDKIKVMTQREFEELLSPNRKIMITPYLLFYARSNLQ